MALEKKDGGVEDINFTEVKKEKFDPLNTEPITENLRKEQFAPPPSDTSKPFESIPEPTTQFRANPGGQYFGGGTQPPRGASTQQAQQSQPINPDFNDIPDSEKDEAAEQAAEMILSLYAGLKGAAPKLIIITERKLKKMEDDGLINLSLPLQKSPNDPTKVTILDIVRNFNNSVSQGYTVTKEFKDQVRPVLIRVLKKKGVGLTDEQFLLFAFGQDLVQTGFHLIAGVRQRNECLNQLKDIFAAYKASGGVPTNAGASTAPPPPPPPQPSQNVREPEETPTNKDNFQKAESKTSNASSGVKPDLIVNPTDGRRNTRRRRERKIQ